MTHTLHSINRIEGYWQGKSLADFNNDGPLRSATERHLLIIAEASKHIPDAEKAATPQIPWKEVRSFGNLLRHGYDLVDPQRVWAILLNDLPALRTAVEAMISRQAD